MAVVWVSMSARSQGTSAGLLWPLGSHAPAVVRPVLTGPPGASVDGLAGTMVQFSNLMLALASVSDRPSTQMFTSFAHTLIK